MTISTTIARNDYSGAGSVGPYVYGFPIYAATDLQVIKRSSAGVESTLAYLTDYSVAGTGNATGGSVTLTTALATGEALTIRRAMPLVQSASLRNQGTYFPETIEDQLDKAVAMQQQQQDAIDRSIKLPVSYSPSGRTLTLTPDAGKAVVGDGTAFTMATLDSGATALPGGGRTVASVSAYLANNAVFNILDYGASPSASAGVNTAAINAAAVAAGNTKLLYFPAGTYATNGTITITGSCLADGEAILNYTGTGNAIHVGDGSGLVQVRTLVLPQVVSLSKPATGWTGAGAIGIRFRKVYDCDIYIPYVSSFVVGVQFYGVAGDGCDYNTVRISYLRNNKINLQMDSVAAAGWVNENVFLGGRLAHDNAEGAAASGTRHIQILGASNYPTVNIDVMNNHRFIGMSLEGDVPEYHVETHGNACTWTDCRWETATSARFQTVGLASVDNWVRGGYDAHKIVFSRASSGGFVRLDSREGMRVPGAPAYAVATFINYDSNDTPALGGSTVDQSINNVGTANLTWSFTGQRFRGKQSTDVYPRVWMDFTAGQMLVGDGATGNPTWGFNAGVFQRRVRTLSADASLGAEGVILADATSGVRQFGLPAAATYPGMLLTVVKIDAVANQVTLNRAGSDTINGAASLNIGTTQYSKTTITNDGVSKWYVIG